jgi:hypothetical protein
VFIPDNELPFWERYAKLRRVCSKDGEWEDTRFFVNISGNVYTKFDDDINKELQSEVRITGRNCRTLAETAGSTLSPTQRQHLHYYENHSSQTAEQSYALKNADRAKQGHEAVQAAFTEGLIKEKVVPNIQNFFPAEEKFPDLEEAEDKICVMLKLKSVQLSRGLYADLRTQWKAAAIKILAKKLGERAFKENDKAFDDLKVLKWIRENSDWVEDRYQLREIAKEEYLVLTKSDSPVSNKQTPSSSKYKVSRKNKVCIFLHFISYVLT